MKDSDFFDLFKGIKAVGEVVDVISEGVQDFFRENEDLLNEYSHYIDNFEEIHKEKWILAAQNGWFPNDFITLDFEQYVDKGKDEIDTYMVEEIQSVLGNIHQRIVELYPERKQILDAAFELHTQSNYIASIPLFLTQTDGIFAKHAKSYLFTERDKRIKNVLERIGEDSHKAIILAPLLQNTEFSEYTGNSNRRHKDKAPNRNGILHGSSKHLDYGTKINSLKCISLLAYVSTIFNDD